MKNQILIETFDEGLLRQLETRSHMLIEELEKTSNLILCIEKTKNHFSGNNFKPVSQNLISKKQKCIISTAFVTMVVASLFFYNTFGIIKQHDPIELNGKYVIENLRGDTVDTWRSWRVTDGKEMTVNIVNSGIVTQDKIDAIKDSILSKETEDIDDSLLGKGPAGTTSLYYKGWAGALAEAATHSTTYYIPTVFSVIESPNGEGEIIITLTNLEDADGYSGYTKSVTDGNQILKSSITIYNVDELTLEQISTITRHEFGHALGLAHSTATEDLMAPSISTPYPFVSECDVDALVILYDGQQSSQVVCEK